ncbi:MAG: hypothetical protein ACKVJ7_07235, partial [Candidatus Poseidoniales archaeon]
MDDPARPMRLRSLLLTTLMLTTSLAMVFAAPVTADSGRSTGNEEVQVSITGGDEYFDRDSQFTVSVTSSNLDSATEYTLDWHLCTTYSNIDWDPDLNVEFYTYSCDNDVNTDDSLSGTIDLGSGNNAVQLSTFTFDDPGLFDDTGGIMSGLFNGTYVIEVELNVQGVHLDDNVSDAFTMGGKLNSGSQINDNSNILISQTVDVDGQIYFDHSLRNLLTYDINCGLYEDGVTTAVDTDSSLDRTSDDWDIYLSGMDLQPVNGGTHHIECTAHRDADGNLMGTIIGADFQVINADVTGNEELIVSGITSQYYDRSDAMTTTQITLSIELTDLYVGTEYTLDWHLCTAYDNMDWDPDLNDWFYTYSCDNDVNTDASLSGTQQVMTTGATQTETFTFDDPGLFDDTGGIM